MHPQLVGPAGSRIEQHMSREQVVNALQAALETRFAEARAQAADKILNAQKFGYEDMVIKDASGKVIAYK